MSKVLRTHRLSPGDEFHGFQYGLYKQKPEHFWHQNLVPCVQILVSYVNLSNVALLYISASLCLIWQTNWIIKCQQKPPTVAAFMVFTQASITEGCLWDWCSDAHRALHYSSKEEKMHQVWKRCWLQWLSSCPWQLDVDHYPPIWVVWLHLFENTFPAIEKKQEHLEHSLLMFSSTS